MTLPPIQSLHQKTMLHYFPHLKQQLKHLFSWQLVALILMWLVVVITNLSLDKQLIGWDNLLPQLNFASNLRNAFFGVWQEHQGLGHIGGHGYAATIVHTITIWIMSLVLPQQLLRSGFNLFMLLVGAIGCFQLTSFVLTRESKQNRTAALVAGMFYMLNLSTIQNFYIPLEAFTVHFALLPWLIFTLISYLSHPSKKGLLLFFITNVFAIPMGFVPPLFVVYVLFTGIILVAYLLKGKFQKNSFFDAAKIIGVILCAHAFWLFPVIHYTVTRSNEYLNSYSNLTTTQDFILRNLQYGNFINVALLKGFYFESLDSEKIGVSFKILAPWIDHLSNPLIPLIGYGMFVLLVFGWTITLFKKTTSFYARVFVLLALLSFTALATNIPIFGTASYALREYLPVFRQAFRIAFTKFSISLSLWYSVFLGFGVFYIIQISTKHLKRIQKLFTVGFSIVYIGLLVYYALPVFNGKLFYYKAKLSVPPIYTDLINFFKQQPTSERIANFSQGWRTGWIIYNWGYSGSGFLWYALPQPMLDRSFDVWSQYNETYFWEISDAINHQDYPRFDTLMDKYAVTWVLFDPNAQPYQNGKEGLYNDYLNDHLQQSDKYTLTKHFVDPENKLRPISVYRISHQNRLYPLVSASNLKNILPMINHTDRDQAYSNEGDYYSDTKTQFSYFYPFRNLFSGRNPLADESGISETDSSLEFTNSFKTSEITQIQVPSVSQAEDYIPAKLYLSANDDKKTAIATIETVVPQIKLDDQIISNSNPTKINVDLPVNPNTIRLVVNSNVSKLIDLTKNQPIYFLLSSKSNNSVDIQINNILIHKDINLSSSNQPIYFPPPIYPGQHTFTVTVPKVNFTFSYESDKEGDFFDPASNTCGTQARDLQNQQLITGSIKYWRFISKTQPQCMGMYFPQYPHDTGYLISLYAKNVSGKPTLVEIQNLTTQLADNQTYLNNDTDWKKYYLIQSPQKNNGVGYSITFNTSTVPPQTSTNDLSQFAIWPIPYNFLTRLKVNASNLQLTTDNMQPLSVSHPNPAEYWVTFTQPTTYNPQITTLTLWQSFNTGWQAYVLPSCKLQVADCRLKNVFTQLFPYLFGKRLTNHVLVNNWANGWTLNNEAMNQSNNVTIYIFFWPQMLEFLGFVILPFPFLYCIWPKKKISLR